MNSTADVVVIGAGIVGAAVAHTAAQSGLRVTVLERGLPGGAGSGSTAGNVHVQTIHTRRPGQSVPVDVRRLLPLQLAARRLWEHWEESVGPVGFRRSGGFMVAETPEQVAELHRKHRWEAEIGISSEVLDASSARSAVPLLGPAVAAATWCPLDGFADPALVTPALVRAAVNAGAAVCVGTEVTALQRAGGTWSVSAGQDRWQAPVVVNAAGPWAAGVCALAGCPVRIAPTVIQMHLLRPGAHRLPSVIAHVAEGMSVKRADSGIMVGGGWPAGPFDGCGGAVDPASTAGNLAQVRRIMPGLADCELDRVWTGPLAVTADEMPVLGEMPGAPGLFVVGGTYSFTFAPLWGQLTAALITGDAVGMEIGDLGPGRLLAHPAEPMTSDRNDQRENAGGRS